MTYTRLILMLSLQLPDDIKDRYMAEHGTTPSVDVLTFCKRELMQCIWLLLLDDEFMKAYEHGMLVTCGDGVTRRLFPRIFTYSADYPEKYVFHQRAGSPSDHSLITSQDAPDCPQAAVKPPLPSLSRPP